MKRSIAGFLRPLVPGETIHVFCEDGTVATIRFDAFQPTYGG
jgi:hypothetical protein